MCWSIPPNGLPAAIAAAWCAAATAAGSIIIEWWWWWCVGERNGIIAAAAAQSAGRLLDKLRAGWNDMGLWAGALADGASPQEVVMADEELRYRLLRLERNCLWHAADMDAQDHAALAPLWASLTA